MSLINSKQKNYKNKNLIIKTMKKFRFLDHTADVLFEAYGKTLDKLFINAALALQETQVNIKTVKPKQTKKVYLKSDSIEMLLFDFLQELIFLKDSKELLFSKFTVNVKKNKNYSLKADCYGEKIDPKKHKLGVDAKAITLHEFQVKKEKGRWKAHIIVDI